MDDVKKIYYFSSTHWDREWYRPFQGFRYRLVKTVNKIIDTLEKDEDFKSFTFDGQTIVLDDYCEIMPQNEERLKTLIKDGRINVGPWYVMPDEFLCSGESLIKNLQIGHNLAIEYGAKNAMKYGYICDIFGHIGQLPQIFSGFDIKGALLGRGTNDQSTPAHFIWEGYDGSQCVTFKVPEECGYGTFWLDVWAPYTSGKDLDKNHIIDRACMYIESERKRTDLPYIVLMDAMDHMNIQPLAPWLASNLSNIYGCPVVFESLENMVDEILPYMNQMHYMKGELNKTAQRLVEHNMLITYTLSSRYDIKKENDECQTLLEKWCLPLHLLSKLKNHDIPSQYIEEAYKLLISCHAHDSICGCSIDDVHKDMHYRFRQVKAIANELVFDVLSSSIAEYNTDTNITDSEVNFYSDTLILSIFNPMIFERDETITVQIFFPCDYKYKFYEQSPTQKINSFKIYDYLNNEIPYTLVNIKNNQFIDVHYQDYKDIKDVYTVSFNSKLSALGETKYYIRPQNTPSRYLKTLAGGFNFVQNDFIRLSINDNGTIDIFDKTTNKNYRNLLSFLDDAEIGDGWHHVSPINNRVISSNGFATSIEIITNGPTCTIFRINKKFLLPVSINSDTNNISRTDLSTTLEIISDITFYSDSKYIDIKTRVLNTVKDHRLKLVIPTGITNKKYYADQTFALIERDVGIDEATSNWKEFEKCEKSFESIVFKKDESGNGLAFISKSGMHECAALDDELGTINITLFRGFSKTFLTNGENDGQLLGELVFKYRILPLGAQDTFASLLKTKDCFQSGLRNYTYPIPHGYIISKSDSILELKNENLVLSILKSPIDSSINGLVLRIFNASLDYNNSEISCNIPFSDCFETNLLETKINSIEFLNNKIKLSFRPYEFKTIMILL